MRVVGVCGRRKETCGCDVQAGIGTKGGGTEWRSLNGEYIVVPFLLAFYS